MKGRLFWAILFATIGAAQAQVAGGANSFAWLRSAPSAQATGLGGWQLRHDGRDPALAAWNPAALNVETERVLHASQDFMPTGATRSVAAVGYRLRGPKLDLGAHVRYADFGDFQGREVNGDPTAEFSVQEYSAGLSVAKHIDERLHLGLSVNVIGGALETYNSLGASVLAGLMYTPDSARRTVIGVQLQDLGTVWNDYAEGGDQLPFSLSVGVSRRLRYLPLRVGMLYRRLDRWDLLYDDPARRDRGSLIGGEGTEASGASTTLDNFARHLAVNAELYIGKTELLQLRVGYDHQRQRESKVGRFRSMAGFSYGLGLNLRRLRFDVGHTIQHLAGGSTQVGLLVDFGPVSPKV